MLKVITYSIVAIMVSFNVYAVDSCKPLSNEEFKLNIVNDSDLIGDFKIVSFSIEKNQTVVHSKLYGTITVKGWVASNYPKVQYRRGDVLRLYLQKTPNNGFYKLTNDNWINCNPPIKFINKDEIINY